MMHYGRERIRDCKDERWNTKHNFINKPKFGYYAMSKTHTCFFSQYKSNCLLMWSCPKCMTQSECYHKGLCVRNSLERTVVTVLKWNNSMAKKKKKKRQKTVKHTMGYTCQFLSSCFERCHQVLGEWDCSTPSVFASIVVQ